MQFIFEVTGWEAGFWGSFKKPLVVLVWADNVAKAMEIAMKRWNHLRVSGEITSRWDQVSVGPAPEQDPVAYGMAVTEIVNLPMEYVERAWLRNAIPESARTRRPVYLVS